jgi:signal transduction histidine kinase
LVKNAIQSIPEQQENKTVLYKKDLNNVLIIVEDNGIGFKPEDISPYFRT